MRTIIASIIWHLGYCNWSVTHMSKSVVQDVLKVRIYAHSCSFYQSSWLLSSYSGLA